MGNVGIIGRARAGKDTIGRWLVEERGYRRIAFADPLKEAALRLDPIVGTDMDDLVAEGARLGDTVRFWGWERAKEIGDTRRILQELGAAIRAIDPDFWLRTALTAVRDANDAGVPVVITDVRYHNEVDALRRERFHLIHVDRPDIPYLDHESEGALTSAEADHSLWNTGTIEDLHEALAEIMREIGNIEYLHQYRSVHT